VLASAVVRHVGEALAVVVADDPYRAADAAEKRAFSVPGAGGKSQALGA